MPLYVVVTLLSALFFLRVYLYLVLTLQSVLYDLLRVYMLYVVLYIAICSLQSAGALGFSESISVCGNDFAICLCSMFYC